MSEAQQQSNTAGKPRGTVSPRDVIAFLSVPLPAFHGRTGFELLLGIVVVWAVGLAGFGVLTRRRRRRVGTA